MILNKLIVSIVQWKLGCFLKWHLQVAWHCRSFVLFLQTDNLWELATTKLSLRWLFIAFLNHSSRLKRQETPFSVPSNPFSTVMPTKNWEGSSSWWLLSRVLPMWFCYYLALPSCPNPISLSCKLYGMGSEHAQDRGKWKLGDYGQSCNRKKS